MKKQINIIIALFSFIILTACSKSDIKDYKHAPDANKSTVHELAINNQKIFVEKFKDFDYAHIELTDISNAVVSFNGNIEEYVISPISKNIKGIVENNKLSFSIPGAGYYVVTINNDFKLFILADKPSVLAEGEASGNFISISQYVSDKSGKSLLTEQLQKALDEISGTGKTLYFEAGIYRTGMLSIRSNSNIYLEEGAMIKGSEDRDDYPTDGNRSESDHINNKDNFTDNGEFMTFSRLIYINDAENVRISGRGIIDGSGSIVRAQGKPANLIRIRNSKNVEIDGIILRDPASWNTHILYSENVKIHNVKVLNDFDVANTDGFDPDASRNVLIENCFAYCNDDNIAIKTTNNGDDLQNLENIRIKDCVFYTKKSSLKVGTETKAELMEDILFENNDVIESDRGIVLYCNDGAKFKNIRFINNRFERAHKKGQQKGIHFLIKKRYGKGHIEDILIKDCVFYKSFPKTSEIYGLDEEHLIKNVKIENLIIEGKKISSLIDANIKVNEFTENILVK